MPARSDLNTTPRRPAGDGDGSLRSVPGGYDIDRLPIAVPREPDENLNAWAQRAAYRYGTHARAFLGLLGLKSRPQRLIDVKRLLESPEGEAGAARIGADRSEMLEDIGLTRMLHELRGRFVEIFGTEMLPATRAGSKWCPQCLGDYGYWMQAWSEPLLAICHRCDLWLESTCPKCGAVPFSDAAWSSSHGDVLHCSAFIPHSTTGRYRQRCGADLRDVPHRDVQPENGDLHRQLVRLIVTAATNPAELVDAAGMRVTAESVVFGLLELLGGRESPFTVAYLVPALGGLNSPVMGTAPVLRIVAMSPTSRAATYARQNGYFDRAGAPTRLLGSQHSTRSNPQTPFVTALWMSELVDKLPPEPQLRFRFGSGRPRYPDEWQQHNALLHPLDAHPGLPLSWVPQAVWPGALQMEDQDLLGLDSPRGRVFVALCLAKYGTTRSWRTVASALGLPATSAKHFARYWPALRSANRVAPFLVAIDDLFHRLHHNPPPIDYHQRRVAAWDPAEFMNLLNTELRRRGTVPVHPLDAWTSNSDWATYTGGVTLLAPPSYARPKTATSPRLHLTGGPDDRLIDGTPVTWTPP